ncbi:MAG: hypothetical protein II932_07010, partial [Treponema sp.]|nr:hypothetical protein [Treponema sp.]
GSENAHEHYVATNSASNYVYLTDPASTFRFWTSQCEDDNVWNGSYGPGWLGYVPSDYAGAAKTLAALKTLLQGADVDTQVFDVGDFNETGGIETNGSINRSHYQLYLSPLSDADYTAADNTNGDADE